MTLNNKSILIISPEKWDHLHISKHHYAIELGKRNNNVFFLGPPEKRYSTKSTSFKNVHEIYYNGFPKGLRYLPKFIRSNFQKSVLKQLEIAAGVKFDIIWSFDNSVFTDFDRSSNRINISHIVDFSQNFSFEQAAKTANINFSISDNILEKQKKYNLNSFRIAHAIDEDFFNENYIQNRIKLPGNNKIKALTFGNLRSPYIDWQLAFEIYKAFEEVDFIHAGPHNSKQNLPDNVFFIGEHDKTELPGLMQSVNFLFVFYDYKKYRDQLTNSHKILEYLSSGKPVICNQFSDYKNSDLLIQCNSINDYLNAIKEAVQNDENPELKDKRLVFAAENTYKKRLEEIEKLLDTI